MTAFKVDPSEVAACIEAGMDAAQAAEKLGCTRSTIWNHCKKLGIRTPGHTIPARANRGRVSKISDELFEQLWRSKIPTKVLAERLGVARQSISGRAMRMGLPHRSYGKISRELFSELWTAGVAARDIQRVAGYETIRTVYVRRHEIGLPARYHFDERGRRIANKTISLEQYREIKIAEAMGQMAA